MRKRIRFVVYKLKREDRAKGKNNLTHWTRMNESNNEKRALELRAHLKDTNPYDIYEVVKT